MKNVLKNIAIVAVTGLAVACGSDNSKPGYTFMDDMYQSLALESYATTDQFANGLVAQNPVEGTVPRNYVVYEYEDTPEGYELAKAELMMPAEFMTAQAAEEGKELYGIFCTHCHGDKGDGQGHLVKIEKFPPVPGYTTRDLTPGSMYHVIMYGKGLMGSHASQLTNDERWKIVRYVQELRGDNVVAPVVEEAVLEDAHSTQESTEEIKEEQHS